jgi:hypothetical protein
MADRPMVGNADLIDPGIPPNGEPRTTPPISLEKFVQAFTDWMNDSAPCPRN